MKSVFSFLKMFMTWLGVSILVVLLCAAVILSLPIQMVIDEYEEDPVIEVVQETKEQNISNEENVEES